MREDISKDQYMKFMNKLYEEDPESFITLYDEEENGCLFLFGDIVPYQGKEYVMLLPKNLDEIQEGASLVILEMQEEEGDMEYYLPVEDEGILQTIFTLYMEQLEKEGMLGEDFKSMMMIYFLQ